MKMLDSFKDEIGFLENRIVGHYEIYEEENRIIVKDGIVDLEAYYNCPCKILWILKEPYDKDGKGYGDWSIDDIFNKEWMLEKKSSTWFPLIYTSYAIVNKHISCYDDMDDIENDHSMIDVLRKIAFINISKFAGETTSVNTKLSKEYSKHKSILLDQIKVYNPDIIIFGGTAKVKGLLNDLNLDYENSFYNEYNYWVTDNKIYIDAYHPGAGRKNKEWWEEYVNCMINFVKDGNVIISNKVTTS